MKAGYENENKRLKAQYVEIRTAALLVARKPFRGLMLVRSFYIATPVMNYAVCIVLDPPLPPFVLTTFYSSGLCQVAPTFIASTARNLQDAWARASAQGAVALPSKKERVQAVLFEVLPYSSLVLILLGAIAVAATLIRRQLQAEADEENARTALAALEDGATPLLGPAPASAE